MDCRFILFKAIDVLVQCFCALLSADQVVTRVPVVRVKLNHEVLGLGPGRRCGRDARKRARIALPGVESYESSTLS